MKDSLKMILVLVIVSFISGASLALVYGYVQPQIMAQQDKGKTILKVLPGIKTYQAVEEDGEEIYIGKDKEFNIVGYAVFAKGAGYQGNIILIAGLDPRLEKITGIEILESVETPGLGGMIASDDFRAQFENLFIVPQIDLVKEPPEKPNEVQAITGATISSKAVIEILNNKIDRAKRLLKK